MEEAQKEYNLGIKIINSSYFFKSLFFNQDKYDDAIPHFERSLNLYKINKNTEGIVNCYEKIISCYQNLKKDDDEISTYISYFQYLKNKNNDNTSLILKKILDRYSELCDIKNLVKWNLNAGDFYENQGDHEIMLDHYSKAYQYDSELMNIEYKTKYANYLTQYEKYDLAQEIYENILEMCQTNRLLRFSQSNIYLQMILIHLCKDDLVSARKLRDRFLSDYNISDKKLEVFITELLLAYEKYDSDSFVNAIRDYERISKIDNLKINLLLRAKNNLSNDLSNANNEINEDNLV
jgi:alpha-soluble NSF attachment protein